MRLPALLLLACACREPRESRPSSTPVVPLAAPSIAAARVADPRPEPPPRPFGKLADETVLGAIRIHQGPTRKLAFHDGELWIATWDGVLSSTHSKDPADGASGLWVWNPTTRTVLRRAPQRVTDFAIASAAGVVATIDQVTDRVALVDQAFAPRWSITIADANSIAIAPDGTTIVVGDGHGTLHVLDDAGHTLWSESVSTRYIADVAISPSGRYIASDANDDVVIFDRTTRAKVATLAHGTRETADGDQIGGVSALAFSPDERAIATGGGERTIRIFDLPAGTERRRIHELQDVLALAWSPDGAWLASGGDDREVKLWRVLDGRPGPLVGEHASPIGALAFSPDGNSLWSGAGGLASNDFLVKQWDVATGEERDRGGHSGHVSDIAVSTSGTSMITLGTERQVIEWDLRTNRERGSFTETYNHLRYAISADAHLVAHAGDDGDIVVVRVPGGTTLATIPTGDADVDDVALSRDGTRLAAILGNEIAIYALPSGKRVRRFTPTDEGISAIGFCDAGRAVWFLGLAGVAIQDAATGKPRGMVPSPSAFRAVDVSADCTRIATTLFSGPDGVTVYDVATKRMLSETPGYRAPVLSPDGATVAALDDTGSIAIIDASTGHVARTYPGHASRTDSLAFLPDGRVVSGGTDALVKIWPR